MTRDEFLAGVSNWDNHRILLWEALERTKDSQLPVLELGCGDGSTPFLRKYCQDNRRSFYSFDNDPEWAKKHDSFCIPNWDIFHWFWKKQYSVVLIDEAPGEHRKVALELFASHPIHFDIIIIHDSEPVGWNASDYQVRPLFDKFTYIHDLKAPKPGAWATWLSNRYKL